MYLETTENQQGGLFMNIGILILMIIGGGVGVLSSLYIALSFPAVIVWKIYRKIRYGYKLTY